MSEPLTFATLLRFHRRTRGLSQAELAQSARLSKTTLSNWEAERTRPSTPELESLLEALELSVTERRNLRHLVARPRALIKLPEGERPPLTGGLLRALRLRCGLTQSEVARRLAMRQGTLAKWEKSEDWPTVERLTALCQVLEAHPEEVEAILQGVFLPLPLSQDASLEQLRQAVGKLRTRVDTQPDQPLLDLHFLELESLLLLRGDEPGAQEFLWQLWSLYAIALCYQARYDEALLYTNRLLALSYDPQTLSSGSCQVAVIKKATALLRPLEKPGAYRPRLTRAALRFLQDQEARIGLPECQAWYWMYLAELLVTDHAYEEAERCIERSNAIPHAGEERIETPEARLVTAHHLTDLGKPRHGLELLNSPIFDAPAVLTPWLQLRRTYYRAKALVELQEVAEADELIRQCYALIEAHTLKVMRGPVDALAFRLLYIP